MAYHDDYLEDRKKIEQFLREIESLFENISNGKISLKDGPVLPQRAQILAGAAFEEYRKVRPEEDLRYRDPAYLPPANTLAKGGLLGKQLAFKLSLFEHLKDRFKRNPVRRLLLKLIDAIDNTLDSLVALTGVDHALKEIKDTLRGWIGEAGEE